ncbi:MAG: hypothetical protein MZV49_01505 [Rhodopseudomonas palustris]|nr:hypothetical protein [Rhodopseudomonas palustris]
MKQEYQLIISNILPILLGRKKTVLAGVAAAAAVALLVYASVGERYEPYTLLRVGQGIKDRSIGSAGSPLGEGVDLVSRIDLAGAHRHHRSRHSAGCDLGRFRSAVQRKGCAMDRQAEMARDQNSG